MAFHKFKGADGIRGLACLIVVVLHNTSTYIPSSGSLTNGVEKYGVWIFFILSAFLLTYRLINQAPSISTVLSYLVSRAFRIIPAFYVCAILFYLNGNYDYTTLKDLLLLKGSYAHLWTIPVEFKFYFLLPLFAYAAKYLMERHGTRVLLSASIIAVVIHQIAFPYFDVKPNSIEVRWYLPVFLFGVIAAVLKRYDALSISGRAASVLGIAVLASAIMASPGVTEMLFGSNASINLMNKFIPLGIMFSVFIYIYCDGLGFLGSVISNSFFRIVGKYSFSIYLYHWFFLKVGVYVDMPSVILICISISLSLIVGATMYYIVEAPCNYLRGIAERSFFKKAKAGDV